MRKMLQVMSLNFEEMASPIGVQFNQNRSFRDEQLRFLLGFAIFFLQWLSFILLICHRRFPELWAPSPESVNFRKNYSPRHRTIHRYTSPSSHTHNPTIFRRAHAPTSSACWMVYDAPRLVRGVLALNQSTQLGALGIHAHCCVLYLVTHAFSPL